MSCVLEVKGNADLFRFDRFAVTWAASGNLAATAEVGWPKKV